MAVSSISLCAGLSIPAGRAAQAFVRGSTSYSGLTSTFTELPTLATQAWNQKLLTVTQAEQAKDFTVPAQFQGKTIRSVPLPSGKKVIALTFDDGPSEKYTNDILYILEQHGVKATFFLLGRNVQNFPARAKQVHLKGHAVANHSWSHPYAKQSPASSASQIDNTDVWIERATGVKPKFFRPPGGYLHTGLAEYAAQKGQVVAMWSADSKDYYASAPSMVKRILKEATPGGIVLLHDGGGDRTQTVIALPTIIKNLQQQGYEFVTLPELLTMQDQEMKAIAAQKAAEAQKAAAAQQAAEAQKAATAQPAPPPPAPQAAPAP
ncbi:polysaccharide deacetylase family protein [Spirulina major CS-329]|uniref:polysaccharide deacetylase family protein n=1 Tax=Spirulina TaxID=1154 RepID=UPI002330FFB7|nr:MULTISPECIES: polysaccharide deacetylase family protein [Spirulina]MDB9493719.1 polysaccharide deacetylase family protein [Spirulina subsalsa CS-330]MDB9505434.1 polysaccharide deacetylase family protein [Spirulina major CS-329]